MSKLKRIRGLIFIDGLPLLAALNVLPAIFGEGRYLSVLAIAGWLVGAVLIVIYFYGFLTRKDW